MTLLSRGDEQIISGDKPETIAWDSHESGRALLLRLRGLEQFQSPRGQSLFRVVNSHMVCFGSHVQPIMLTISIAMDLLI